MGNPEQGALLKAAISKLTGSKPKAWDTDARDLFETVAHAMHADISAETIEATWRDAMAYMRENAKDEWDQYARFTKKTDMVGVSWDKVKLVKGQSDGDSFTLHFDVDGIPCVVECTDVQLLDPSFIQRKLVMYTRKDVSCPYLGKKQLEAWRRNVVIPWLKGDAFMHTERQTMGDMVDDLVREFCANTVAANDDGSSWLQLKRSVADKGIIYVPFSGLQEFIGKHAGDAPTKKIVKNSLVRLGFTEVKKGRRALRFHALPSNKLYEEIDSGEAGGGKIDTDSEQGSDMPAGGGPRLLDKLREEKRERSETEGGQWPSAAETLGGTSDVSDNP